MKHGWGLLQVGYIQPHCLQQLPRDCHETSPEFWSAVPLQSQATHRVGFTLAAQDFRDTKVSDLDNHAMFVQEDVLSLQVTVQDLLGVHMVKSQEDLHEEVQDGVLVQQGVTALMYKLG